MTGTIRAPYAISLVGFVPEIITKPFSHRIPEVRGMLLMYSTDERSVGAFERARDTLEAIGVSVMGHQIRDIFNFFEIYYTAERYMHDHGEPRWINTSAGPGLGSAALSHIASLNDIDLLSYNRDLDTVRMVRTSDIEALKTKRRYVRPILEAIRDDPDAGTDALQRRLGLSPSTISRRLKQLRSLELVEISGSGSGGDPYRVRLTEWGETYLDNTV